MNIKNKRVKALVSLGIAGSLVLGLGACASSGGAAGGGDKSIQLWVLQDQLDSAQKAAVETFNKTSDVKIVYNEIANDGYQDKVRTAMGSNQAPDIFFNWSGGSIRDYVDAGKLLSLDDAIAKDPSFKDAFVPSIFDVGQIDGKQYAVPMRGTQPVVMFYNKSVLSSAGVTAPTSMADVMADIPKLAAAGVTPFALAGAGSWTELMWLEYLVDRIGGPEVFKKIEGGDTTGWSDPAILEAATQIKTLVDAGAFGTNFGSVNYGSGGTSTLLAEGRAGMQLMGTWEFATQLGENPDFAKNDLGYVAFPSVAGGAGDPSDVVGNPSNYFSVNSATKYPDTAIAFLKSLSSAEYTDALLAGGEVPTTTATATKLDTTPNPDFANFQFDLVKNAPSFQLSWDQAISPTISAPLLTELQKLFNGQDTPEQFVAAVLALK
ncbi:ABC transporter substrate-binding protein [Subtercola frigoramans]|uniref:Xylobiose transport system substrate-binding protein n=1 Tax=Subtercola frigoramans TaxID=120298 RepID=A0ABS2L059_9MICO|nr:extracellular solute-binding protein [Subtercola frigoramans]MBM7470471.1 xylobiose transport system substrate-binding protein [Subtercola frigoramans]